MVRVLEVESDEFLNISDDLLNDPNFRVTIRLPYYAGDEYLEYYEVTIKAADAEEAEFKANKLINNRKKSINGQAWKDAKVVEVYEI